MKTPLSTALTLALCLGIAVQSRTQDKAPVGTFASPVIQVPGFPSSHLDVRGPLTVQFYGSCTGEISPSLALIAGGVAVQGLKPLEASESLDKQIDAVRKYVDENHGKLILLERVRTLKNPAPNGSSDSGPPFEIVQRLHAEFPVGAPIDAILQRLLELGLDRFGETVLSVNGHREEAVLFRIGQLDSTMRDMEQRCIADAWKTWCATDAAKGLCKTTEPPSDLQLISFNVRSEEEVLLPGTGAAYWSWVYMRGQQPRPSQDLLGNITFSITGTASVNFTFTREEKP